LGEWGRRKNRGRSVEPGFLRTIAEIPNFLDDGFFKRENAQRLPSLRSGLTSTERLEKAEGEDSLPLTV
jgi:hypothetical protein